MEFKVGDKVILNEDIDWRNVPNLDINEKSLIKEHINNGNKPLKVIKKGVDEKYCNKVSFGEYFIYFTNKELKKHKIKIKRIT